MATWLSMLPLAQMLLTLFDELTNALHLSLPLDAAEERWPAALEQLRLPIRNILADETQLVRTLWKNQPDNSESCTYDALGK